MAIYTHVGFEFRAFTKAADRSTSVSTSTTIPTLVAMESRTATGSSIYRKQSDTPGQESEDLSSFIKHELDRTRRASGVISIAETINSKSSPADCQTTSPPPHQLSNAPEHNDRGQVRSSITSVSTAYTANTGRTITFDSDAQIFPALGDTFEPCRSTVRTDSTHRSHADNNDTALKRMALQRSRINRQLRLLFTYPIAYICMWIIPFTIHCIQYNNYWAQHPPYVLSCLSIFCVTTMGAVDCLIFCLRERPWRHTPASDRAFWGCFCFWRKPVPPSNIEQGDGEKRNSSVGTDPNSAAVRSPSQVPGPFQLPRLAQFRLSKSSD